MSDSLIQRQFVGWNVCDIQTTNLALIKNYMEINFLEDNFICFFYKVNRNDSNRSIESVPINGYYLVGSLKDNTIYKMDDKKSPFFDGKDSESLEEMLFVIRSARTHTFNENLSYHKKLKLLYFYNNNFNIIVDTSDAHGVPYGEQRSECVCVSDHLFNNGCMCLSKKEIVFDNFSILKEVFK